MKEQGFYWHCHHDKLYEWVYDYQKRVDHIKTAKPKDEIETRLKLFKKIKGKLPKELDEAWRKFYEARRKYKPFLEKLHKKECGCKEWNGKETNERNTS